MKTITKMGAQGDILFRRVKALPAGVVERKPSGGQHIVAHSETGHHHVVPDTQARFFEPPNDPFVCYLQLTTEGGTQVEHCRPAHQHEMLGLLGAPGDVWEGRRQREAAPEGWQRVAD